MQIKMVKSGMPRLSRRDARQQGSDALTGALDRPQFTAALARSIEEAPIGALLVIDLDHFRYVNDSVGSATGDQLLAAAAETLAASLRAGDVLGRLAGDEFGALLPGADTAQARLVASRLLQALREAAAADSPLAGHRITASAGVAAYTPALPVTADALLVHADIAMYEAKCAGRDRVCVYDGGDAAANWSGLTWAGRIRTAIERERFVLHAQPILSLTGDAAPRHELLVRMLDEEGRPLPPSAFLEVAERFDLVQELDCWVLHEAIRMLAAEQRAGNDIRLNVNLSAKSLMSPSLSTAIANQLDAEGADGRGLCLEITETAAIVNIDAAQRFAADMAELGCEIALDDFGSGFASYYHLKHLAFDQLKIAGDFIDGLSQSPTNQLVVRSILTIANALGKRTVAEYVSDRETLQLLRELGVDYAQGFHVARPGPCERSDLSHIPDPGAQPPPGRASLAAAS